MDSTGYYVNNKSTWKFTGFDSLLTQKVGVISGYAYAYGEEFDALVKSRPDVFKDTSGIYALDKNFKKLVNNRIDVVVESMANAKLKGLGLNEKLKIAGTNLEKAPIYIACSPSKPTSKIYIDLIEKGTKTLRESGQLKDILDKYGLKDWQ